MSKVAVVGAGGLVGGRVVAGLDKSGIDSLELTLTGLGKSIGKTLTFRGEDLTIEKTTISKLKSADIVVLCTPTEASRQLVSELRGGPVIIDTSSAFRMDPDVPLVIADINPDDAKNHKGLIAGPNCSTIQLVMVLKPILDRYGLERVHVATYQAVSGVGYKACCQLEEESFQRLCLGKPGYDPTDSEFPHPIAFNVIPQVDSFLPDGYTKEEMKMVNESRKILGLPGLRMSCTCVRVPVFIGHCEECLVETREEADLDDLRTLLRGAKGVVVLDNPQESQYPMPIICDGTEEVYVGRIRKDLSSRNGLLMWIAADNLLIGAATNACNLVKLLLSQG
ncbi:MAG TPA: aspartate-semialdehyde dehydrogenase [Firmicutes bacterium]|nr:aspartate-semialdehyde dehydrogenase [Candidatus Fermentithermobacillaceae bacterium]